MYFVPGTRTLGCTLYLGLVLWDVLSTGDGTLFGRYIAMYFGMYFGLYFVPVTSTLGRTLYLRQYFEMYFVPGTSTLGCTLYLGPVLGKVLCTLDQYFGMYFVQATVLWTVLLGWLGTLEGTFVGAGYFAQYFRAAGLFSV
eukprot:5165634-Pyramimonas_sp.AAC.1